MITGDDFYRVMSAMVPLYLAVGLGFASVRWLHVFDKEQCAAINRYVAFFAVPFLCFQVSPLLFVPYPTHLPPPSLRPQLAI